MVWVWPLLLLSSLVVIIALARGGTTLFCRHSNDRSRGEAASPWRVAAVTLLLLAAPLMVILGGPLTQYTREAAGQLHAVPDYLPVLLPGGPS
jgi:multicomponent K+:H+ antiporter subunit D